MVVVPAAKKIHYVLTNPALGDKRGRALGISWALIAGVLALLFLMPFPSRTRTEGVIWPPEESMVRAATDGFVTRIMAVPNSSVKKEQLLIECEDPLQVSQVRVQEAQLREMESRFNAELTSDDQVQAKVTQEEIARVQENLAVSRQRLKELKILSPSDGVFILPEAPDLPDRFLKQGDLVGYVLNVERPTVRVVAPQAEIDLVRQHNQGVQVRLASQMERVIPAIVLREVPGAMERLPSTILGSVGGGEIAIDPGDKEGLKTFDQLFQLDIELTEPVDRVVIGGRVYVRFDHGYSPLGFQAYRKLRQLLLKRFNV